jgi:transglutaminase-like putative cysteine protease
MTEKGERRTVAMLLPGQYQLATARLQCEGRASVPLLDGNQAELLEINCEIRVEENQPTFSTIWTDDDGSIIRTFSPTLNLVAYRTDEATATKLSRNDSTVAAIAVGGKLDKPAESTRVAYRITPTAKARRQETPVDIKPAPGQYIRAMDDGSFQVLVARQIEREGNGFVGSDLAVSDEDLAANHFIDSGATLVRRFADAALSSRDANERDVAVDLARTASQIIDVKTDFSGFTKASVVARDAMGDATEHAILLAAMLRARKIPARLAIGLKYSPGDPKHGDLMHGDRNRMVYHVWTLARVERQWIQLDAIEGALAPADRLIFSTTNLSGGNENGELVPFLETIRWIDIEIVGQN